MLVPADRNFASHTLWKATAGTGAELCWRMSASFTLPVCQVLPDGTYLSELKPAPKADGEPISVRVIEYNVRTQDADGTEVSELFALATTLVDEKALPGDRVGRALPRPLKPKPASPT